ncbi:putative ras-related GTP-binding protein [Trypanosoma theileri]|uniref:Putative ras-related GTP-binding protein n=1 Tax=Trypanosoma theileri TaxID=67003 RepID=A0A1X0P706_9TRYP|nr:putative ras-related GTP-binding protein [Trypanosoma theileri]ORC92648.1 putative ras-related GTP-binding protein [Trypanosoma theileri]
MSTVSRTTAIKIVLCGPSNAGKTSITKRFITDSFDEFQDTTVGSAFFSKQLYSKEHNTNVRVEVWDTAGQEKYRAMAPMYFRHAAGALLVFDETSLDSFKELETVWLPELLPHMNNNTEFIVVCGNKCDAVVSDDQRESVRQAEEVCRMKGMTFFDTSAKKGQNVHEAFQGLVDRILSKREKEAAASGAEENKADGRGKGANARRLANDKNNNENSTKSRCC